MSTLSFWIQMIATAAFAITAVLALTDAGVDLFAAMVLGVITAVGAVRFVMWCLACRYSGSKIRRTSGSRSGPRS